MVGATVCHMTTRIDCDSCLVRGLACHDCMVTVLLGPPPELTFDDDAGSITITNAAKQTVTLATDKITVASAGDAASLTLESSGAITLKAAESLEIDAPTVTIKGDVVTLRGTISATVESNLSCKIRGATVAIN